MTTALLHHDTRVRDLPAHKNANFLDDAQEVTLREALRRVPTPITFVAAQIDGQPVGMVVGSFVGISLEPALVGIYTQKSSSTWPRLRAFLNQGGEVGISVLGIDHHGEVYKLAGPQETRFEREWGIKGTSAIYLDRADSFLRAKAVSISEVGDHEFVLLQVESAHVSERESQALVFHESRIGLVN
ncbi:flavin reductase family protein [Corynebacterium sp. SCR221107]|uniref:flavin reductase family protein n=1 Tax=Corynebacterium sp. SCR221107 TaxID=3017361 RepID=UPI0022EC4FD2|nr:flavin reductase family protein [Corynebacterium sp. SCR221107]WBT08800.1 flavin reductase family protein [Corynebacterium sp. SCR221107]